MTFLFKRVLFTFQKLLCTDRGRLRNCSPFVPNPSRPHTPELWQERAKPPPAGLQPPGSGCAWLVSLWAGPRPSILSPR